MEVKILNCGIGDVNNSQNGISICKYCNNKFNKNSILLKHQRVAKYCLVIQGKLEDPLDKLKYEKEEKEKERERVRENREKEREMKKKEKENKRLLNDKKNKKKEEKEEKDKQKIIEREKREKEEQDRIDIRNKEKEEERNRKIKKEDDRRREKEKKRDMKFICEYCKVKFTTRINYCGHLDICLVKYKKIIDEKEKEKEKMAEEYILLLEEKEKEKEQMKNKWRIKKEKLRVACSRVNTKNKIINNSVIILQATDLSEEKLFNSFSYYGRDYFYRGSTGVADFIQKNILTNSNGYSTVICTDVSRKMFYNNINGKQIKDPGLSILYGKLDYWVKRENRRVFGEEKIMIEEKGDESRDSTNKLIIIYKDSINSSKIIKRLAEFSYVSPVITT